MENMKLLIDTNVILDMFFQRNGSDNSMKLFRKIRDNGDSAYISASSVTDLFTLSVKKCMIWKRRMLLWKIFLSWYPSCL